MQKIWSPVEKINTISVIKHEDMTIKTSPVCTSRVSTEWESSKKKICNEVLAWHIRENITIE